MPQPSRLIVLTLAVLSTLAHAQQTPASSKSIRLDVTVSTRDGKSAPPALMQQDFTLLDNKAPQPLTSFRAVKGTDEPVRVLIVLDALNIRLVGLENARNQISDFLKAHPTLPQRTAVAIFTEKDIQTTPTFTTDGASLKQWIDKQSLTLRTLRDNTGIYGAQDRYSLSVKALRNLAMLPAGTKERTVLLWVSPGWPILSGASINLDSKQQKSVFQDIVTFSTQLREHRVTLYAIDPIGSNESIGREDYYENFLQGIAKPGDVDLGDLSLQVLAQQSGGRVVNSNDTSILLQQAYTDLNNHYVLTFDAAPSEKPDTYHHLELKLAMPGLVALTRDGYYAQP